MRTKKSITIALLLGLLSFSSISAKTTKTVKEKKEHKTEKNMNIKHLTKEEFLTKVFDFEKNSKEWKFEGTRPALIDFFATWCGPCKAISPILEEIAEEYDGQVDIYKVDVDQESEIANAFGIRSVPSLLFIPMNEQPQMAQGAMPKASLKEAIDKVLLKK